MKDSIHIIVSRNRVERMLQTDRFELKPGERAFRLEVEIPDAAFNQPPVPRLKVLIPPEALVAEIEVEIVGQEGPTDA